jgi:hypothetical protein
MFIYTKYAKLDREEISKSKAKLTVLKWIRIWIFFNVIDKPWKCTKKRNVYYFDLVVTYKVRAYTLRDLIIARLYIGI